MRCLARVACVSLMLMLFPSPLPAQALFQDGFEGCHASCTAELTCPAQQAGKACIAGRFLGMEASTPVCTVPSSSAVCTDIEVGGPCALAVRVYDALTFISNPPAASPIASTENTIDSCGRFRISGFSVPASGFALALVDDAPGASDFHVPAAGIYPLASGQELENISSYVLRNSTNQAWTTTAGSPFGGSTFAQQGTYAAIFRHAGNPVAGVHLLSNDSEVASSDFYFSDSQAFRRSTVDASQPATGANGTALFVTGTITPITGTGNEPVGCVWPAYVGGSAPGVVVVKEFPAEVNGAPGTPCP